MPEIGPELALVGLQKIRSSLAPNPTALHQGADEEYPWETGAGTTDYLNFIGSHFTLMSEVHVMIGVCDYVLE